MPDNEGDNTSTGQSESGGVSYFTAPEGYYDGDDRVSATDAEVAALDADITAGKIKSGQNIFGVGGTLAPGGTATVADLFNGETAHLTGDWTLDTGTLDLACNTATFLGTANRVADAYDGGGDGTNRWCMTDSGDAAAADIRDGKKAWVDGSEVTGSYAGTSCTGNATTADVLYPKTFSNSSSTGLTGELHGGCTCCSTCTLYENRWCDNDNGTVTDLTTCLVWLQKAGWGGVKAWRCESSYGWCSDDHDDAHTRAGILKAADYVWLSDGSVEGDWRLPTKTELDGLVNGTPNLRCTSGPCDLYGFTGLQSSYYWSSSTYAGHTHGAWYVYLCIGYVDYVDKGSNNYVWPGHAGQ